MWMQFILHMGQNHNGMVEAIAIPSFNSMTIHHDYWYHNGDYYSDYMRINQMMIMIIDGLLMIVDYSIIQSSTMILIFSQHCSKFIYPQGLKVSWHNEWNPC